MRELYKNKYRIPSARLENWNYANAGAYLVTICTKNRLNYFGKIIETDVETRSIASLHTEQSILFLENNKDAQNISYEEETRCFASLQPTDIGKIAETEWYKSIEIRSDMNLQLGNFIVMPNHVHGVIFIGENEFNSKTGAGKNEFKPQSKNLASIIRGYKSAVTNYARKKKIEFDWQPSFHEHIIRSYDEFYRISDYILNNPVQWQKDKFYTV